MLSIEAWDEVFVRNTRVAANAMVVDPAVWGRWWPGCTVAQVGQDVFDVRWRILFPTPAVHRLRITVDRVRPRDKGLEFSITGDLVGDGEWFGLDHPRGVVVNHLVRGEVHRRAPRVWLASHRAIVRTGLTSLKDRLEGGLPPGVEPDPTLLAHQEVELAIFAEEVARHEAKLAAAAAEGERAPSEEGE